MGHVRLNSEVWGYVGVPEDLLFQLQSMLRGMYFGSGASYLRSICSGPVLI